MWVGGEGILNLGEGGFKAWEGVKKGSYASRGLILGQESSLFSRQNFKFQFNIMKVHAFVSY